MAEVFSAYLHLLRAALRSLHERQSPFRAFCNPESTESQAAPGPLKVAFVTPELNSLVRRTNLAEISESLTRALKASGCDVRVFMPYSSDIDSSALKELVLVGEVEVPDGEAKRTVRIWRGLLGEVFVYLFDEEELFRKRHPYGDADGPYPDNWRRFSVFARAVLASLETLRFSPDVIHCLDWTTGLIPLFRKLEYLDAKPKHAASKAGTYMMVQNLAIQGAFEREILPHIGIPFDLFHDVDGVELGGRVNYLKAGIEFGTIIGTHSPAQATRVVELDRGYGLEECFRRREKEIVGISNGIDYHAWDPKTDPLLPHTFSKDDPELNGKRKCKTALQSALGLDNGARIPVAAIIGRFDSDSGFDILGEVLTKVLESNIEVVLMGTGQPETIERIKTMESSFQGRCRLIDGYLGNTAHAILGGADMMILPAHHHASNSLCAIAQRYGTVPILYAHSGLRDTVTDVAESPEEGTGFFFNSHTGPGLMQGIDAARTLFKEAADWKKLVHRCLAQDFSWQVTADSYLKAYRRVTRRTKGKIAKKRGGE